MTNHAKVYMRFFGYDVSDWIACEWCGARANAIHHIKFRSLVFGEDRDKIENLAALCQDHHNQCHDHPKFNQQIKERHLRLIS